MMRRVSQLIGLLVIILGIGVFFYPEFQTWRLKREVRREIQNFEEGIEIPDRVREVSQDHLSQMTDSENSSGREAAELSEEAVYWTKEVYRAIEDYNRSIFEDGQSDFRDAWAVTQSPAFFGDLKEGIFGYVEIPAMNLTLPLYVGATDSNMAKGAAILGATSLPIGGENTNSVIAGHRGYSGAPYFREIERLAVGDEIFITNAWASLTYQVESIDIIDPTDSDRLRIQGGKDMVTLLTCHPYRSHGRYRYVVYCVRKEDGESAEGKPAADETKLSLNSEDILQTWNLQDRSLLASDGECYESSEADIIGEQLVRRGAALAIIVMVGGTVWRNLPRKRRKDHSDEV